MQQHPAPNKVESRKTRPSSWACLLSATKGSRQAKSVKRKTNTEGIQMDRIVKGAVRMTIDKNRNVCNDFGAFLSNHIGIDRPVSPEHETKEVKALTRL